MSRADPQQAAMVSAFAAQTNRPIRTARWHRQQQTADWQSFVASYSVSGAGPLPMAAPLMVENHPALQPGDASLPSDVDRARIAEAEAWACLQACIAHKKTAIVKKNPELVGGWIKVEIECGKAHREASKHRIQMEIQAGKLRTASEIDEIRTNFLEPVRDLLRTAAAEIGPEANPLAPPIAMAAVNAWFRRRLNPALQNLSKALPVPKGSTAADDPTTGTGEPAAQSPSSSSSP